MSIPNNRIDRSQSLSRQISAQTVPQMRDESHVEEPKSFAPKKPVQLNPPKDDPITPSELKKCDGSDETKPTLVAIKGTVFDVSHNKAYQPGGQYHGMYLIRVMEDCLLSMSQSMRRLQFVAIRFRFSSSLLHFPVP